MPAMDYLYTLSGFAVGAIVGLTGVGGGSLMTPLLVLVFGVHPATAVGTDLLYAALTKAGGTVAHGRKGHVDWSITLRLAAGSIPAAAITIWVLSQLPKGSNVIGAVISHGLGFALFLTAIAILFGKKLRDYANRHEESELRRCCLPKITIGMSDGVGYELVEGDLKDGDVLISNMKFISKSEAADKSSNSSPFMPNFRHPRKK